MFLLFLLVLICINAQCLVLPCLVLPCLVYAPIGRGAAAATLPFQSYGALGMARSEFEADSASTQFFWLLFESDLTPAGKRRIYVPPPLSLPFLNHKMIVRQHYACPLLTSILQSTGKNLLDGRYACFGYTVEGQDLLKDVKEGDVVVSAKVVKGMENLKR